LTAFKEFTMESLESVTALLIAHRPRASSLGYPEVVRRRVGEYVAARRSDGARVNELARELGISHTSVSRWSAAEVGPLQFVAVEVEPEVVAAPPSVLAERSGSVPTLISPRGYRVEGLDLDALTALLGRLG